MHDVATLKPRRGLPKDFAREVEQAEKEFAGTDNSGEAYVFLPAEEIKVRPVLFQPREFSFGIKDVDSEHVARLDREIRIRGELDPILVVRLGDEWVCVDGHHRLAAYKKNSWSEKLKCERFTGASVREAVDEGLRRNSRRQLTLENTDRQEAAWRHVVCHFGSKRDIARNCGVSESQVANMRRVKAAWGDEDLVGKRMRLGAPGGPGSVSWFRARALFLELDEEEASIEVKAQRLARSLKSRMTDKLRRNLHVAARALAIYSPELVQFIRDNEEAGVNKDADDDEPSSERLKIAAERARQEQVGADEGLRYRRERLEAELRAIDAELSHREQVGNISELTWKLWVAEDGDGNEVE
jgi:hypothetical protein